MLSHQRSLGEFMTHYPTLAAPNAKSDREREEFEREWHRLFLFLNKLKGMPARKETRPPAAVAKPVSMPSLRFGPRFPFFGWLFRFVVRLAVLVAAGLGGGALLPLGAGGTQADRRCGGPVGHAGAGSWKPCKSLAANLHLPTLGGVFQPVVERYGPEITAVMVGALFVAIGYWIFIRTK